LRSSAELRQLFDRQRAAYLVAPYPAVAEREARLRALLDGLRQEAAAIQTAISADFGHRSHHETLLLEHFVAVEGIRHARRRVRRWARRERRPVSLWFRPGYGRVMRQPLGVVGIVVPWNYPLYLAVGPLTGALAAGNRVMVKMSEFTPRFGALFADLLGRLFPPEVVAVVNGGVEIAQAFTALPFDHLLFTGSTNVGRQVMRAASEHLTPVTLELGGKSPTIVGPEASLDYAAQRIMFGKCANAGQTCVAPDYLLLPEGRESAFIEAARRAVERMYPTLADNPDYTSIATDHQFVRLQSYLRDARDKGATLYPLHRESPPPAGRKLAPVALTGVTDAMRVMQEEIFGPILPIVPYRTLDEAIAYVNARPRPLALYYFGDDRAAVDAVLTRTISGGATINDTLVHAGLDELPFGGVGPSGMGHYHGKAGFDTFSKAKGIYYQRRLNGFGMLLPPYGKLFDRVMRLMLR
jgi:acyl-CoA reductase-like NAD-dependent aldehyde dehydrogenase